MANRFYSKPKNLAEQLIRLKRKYKPLNYTIENNCLFWQQKVKPTELSKEYTITLVYDGKFPKVYLLNQGIMKKKDEKIKHCLHSKYIDDNNEYVEICLFYPEYKEWTRDMFIADTIIPWAIEWLYYFELWRLTGQWLGGGIEHEKN